MEQLLQELFNHGRIRFENRPTSWEDSPTVRSQIRQAFETDLLSLASPAVSLNYPLALSTARYVLQSAWLVVNRDEDAVIVLQKMPTITPAQSADDLMSADLFLRYLPFLYQRAWAISQDDLFTIHLRQTLRDWPLSGVLANIPEPPLSSLDFFGHRGLQLRYAERLVNHPRPGWCPTDSASLDVVSLVFGMKKLSLDILKVLEIPTPSLAKVEHE